MATPGLIQTVSNEVSGWGKDFLRHVVFTEFLGFTSDRDSAIGADPKMKRTKKNELALSQFRMLFNKTHTDLGKVLDIVFKIMKKSDYVEFSLSVLEAVAHWARSQYDEEKINELIGEGKPFIRERYVITVNVDGKNKEKVEGELAPNLFYDENYTWFINQVKEIMEQVKPDDGEKNNWAKKTVARLTEEGIISQGLPTRIARYLTPKLWSKEWEWLKTRLQKAVCGFKAEFNHQGEGLGTGVRRLTDTINGLRPESTRPQQRATDTGINIPPPCNSVPELPTLELPELPE